MKTTIDRRFAENAAVLAATHEHLGGRIQQAAEMILESYRDGGGVFLFGNGGSAADAQHIAGELVGRFLTERRALKAEALSSNTSILTALANDYSFEYVFARQLQANARAGDVAFAITTSGNSPNVLAALKHARQSGLRTIALTGEGGGLCAQFVDCLLDVPTRQTPRVQEAGTLVYHLICELVEAGIAAK